ncbi:Kelch repeat-containing protein [Sorangium sp. So ce388]|uniref:Kelch repeat-containing protein n=1 Tax=Sorangium sp. So ce388 TaxID=3133309 RepID=UPI003F5C8C69
MLALLLGCSEAADPLDARSLRRQFPEQADAILQGPSAFTLAGDAFESLRTVGALVGRSGETGPRSRFPRRGDGAVRFPLPDGSEVEVRELGAQGEAAVAENAMAYARRGGTSFWTALDDGYEEWLLLEASAVRRDAPVATWQVDGAVLRQQSEAVELSDARGALQMRVTAPEAYTAGGRPVGARLVAQGARIELWVDAEGETVLVDPRWHLKRKMSTARSGHAATQLADGRVLVAGGLLYGDILDSAEVFDPARGTWTGVGPMLTARSGHTATPLMDGRVLIAGGDHFGGLLDSAEMFDPTSNRWIDVAPMQTVRNWHSATLLPDGRVLVAGGYHHRGELPPRVTPEAARPSLRRYAPNSPLTCSSAM